MAHALPPPHRLILLRILATTLVAWVTLPLARADDDLERERLARIAHEVERVHALVAEAARSVPPAQRVQFRYDWLQRDLEMLRAGILQHVDAPRQPRPVPPLRGDYRQ